MKHKSRQPIGDPRPALSEQGLRLLFQPSIAHFGDPRPFFMGAKIGGGNDFTGWVIIQRTGAIALVERIYAGSPERTIDIIAKRRFQYQANVAVVDAGPYDLLAESRGMRSMGVRSEFAIVDLLDSLIANIETNELVIGATGEVVDMLMAELRSLTVQNYYNSDKPHVILSEYVFASQDGAKNLTMALALANSTREHFKSINAGLYA